MTLETGSPRSSACAILRCALPLAVGLVLGALLAVTQPRIQASPAGPNLTRPRDAAAPPTPPHPPPAPAPARAPPPRGAPTPPPPAADNGTATPAFAWDVRAVYPSEAVLGCVRITHREAGPGGTRAALTFADACLLGHIARAAAGPATHARHNLLLLARYTVLRHYLTRFALVFYYAAAVKLFQNPLRLVVADADMEVYSYTCCDAHAAANFSHYAYNYAAISRDVYHGFWEVDDLFDTQCFAAFHFVESGFDPRVFSAAANARTLRFVGDMARAALEGGAAPVEEVTAYNFFLNRGPEKYLFLRKFPANIFCSDWCAAQHHRGIRAVGDDLDKRMSHREIKHLLRQAPQHRTLYCTHWCFMRPHFPNDRVAEGCRRNVHFQNRMYMACAGRIADSWADAQFRAPWDDFVRPLPPARLRPPAPVPMPAPDARFCAERPGDGLCRLLRKVPAITTRLGERAVGVTVSSGTYLADAALQNICRQGLETHTVCVCLDALGCNSCAKAEMSPWPVEQFLGNVSGASQREISNMYKYFVAHELLRRGYGVLSYDLDVVLLRDPWERLASDAVDVFVSTDGPTRQTATGIAQHKALEHAWVRTSINAGFWYARPTPAALALFGRVTAYMRLTAKTGHGETTRPGARKALLTEKQLKHVDVVPAYYFEQAQFGTVLFQARTSNPKMPVPHDVRYRVLPPHEFMNSKAPVHHAFDVCDAWAVHSNYGCPYDVAGLTKVQWLAAIQQKCKPQNC